MRINHKFKPELIAGDEDRLTISQPYLDGSTIVATNGSALVVLPVKLGAGDVDGYVSAPALKAARKDSKQLSETALSCSGSLRTMALTEFVRPKLGAYVNYRQVIPGERKEIEIRFSATLLNAVAEAIGASDGQIVLKIAVDADGKVEDRTAMRVVPLIDKTGAFGALMPCRA